MNLIDSNGTGITALSLNETFSYILLNIKGGDELEEDLGDTFEKFFALFISGFNEQIGFLINAFLNRTLINLANNKLNEFLYSKTCPGIPEHDNTQIDKMITTIAYSIVSSLFVIFIFFPYILGKACKKEKTENKINLLDQENITTELKGIKQEQPIETKYCFDNIKIKWIKELGRTDPS